MIRSLALATEKKAMIRCRAFLRYLYGVCISVCISLVVLLPEYDNNNTLILTDLTTDKIQLTDITTVIIAVSQNDQIMKRLVESTWAHNINIVYSQEQSSIINSLCVGQQLNASQWYIVSTNMYTYIDVQRLEEILQSLDSNSPLYYTNYGLITIYSRALLYSFCATDDCTADNDQDDKCAQTDIDRILSITSKIQVCIYMYIHVL